MAERPIRGAGWVDRVLSLSAGVVAVAAVVIALYQARIEREYQELSVPPYLQQYNTHPPGEGYRRIVHNKGIGPALIRSVRVELEGRPLYGWHEVFSALTGDSTFSSFDYYGSLGPGDVLLPGEDYTLLALKPAGVTNRFHQGVGRLSIRVCYCSFYRQCWESDTRAEAPEPQPVKGCRVPEREFQP